MHTHGAESAGRDAYDVYAVLFVIGDARDTLSSGAHRQFSVDGNPVGAAVAVNSSGAATTSYTVDVPAGAHAITAAFTSTNAAFLNGSNTGTLTVSREDADVSAAATNPFAVKVNAPGGTGGPITLCFEMNEVSDDSPGNTTNITSVTVSVTPIGSGSAVSAGTAVLSGGGVGATRTRV